MITKNGRHITLKKQGFKDAIFTGISGVHYVISELSRRGLVAMATIRNTAGIDVVVTDGRNFHANIQVKSSSKKATHFALGKKPVPVSGHLYYAFVRWLKNEDRYEVFLETSARVRKVAEEVRAKDIQHHIKIFGDNYFFVIRGEFAKNVSRLKRNWERFGLKNKNQVL